MRLLEFYLLALRNAFLKHRDLTFLAFILIFSALGYLHYVLYLGKIADGISVFLILLVLCALLGKYSRLEKEKEKLIRVNRELQEKEVWFRTIFERAPVGIVIRGSDGSIIAMNPKYEEITGRSSEEVQTVGWAGFTHPEDLEKGLESYKEFLSGANSGYLKTKRYIRPNGDVIWVNIMIAPLQVDVEKRKSHLCLVQDITELVLKEKELQESERNKAVLLSHLPGMAYRRRYDRKLTMEFVSEGCLSLTGYPSESMLHDNGISFNDLIEPEYRKIIREEWLRALRLKTVFNYEYAIRTADGEVKWVFENGQGIYNEYDEVEALEGMIVDITDRKTKEHQIQYLSMHDFLTGLYNRRYLNEEKRRLDNLEELPLSVIVADINGIRLINDAFGYQEGDRAIIDTANILRDCCREGDILVRSGSDEFTVLLPGTDGNTAAEIINRIMTSCEVFNRWTGQRYHLSVSLGYDTKVSQNISLEQTCRTAEEHLNKRKLLEHKSSHNAIIVSIKAAMFARSQETEEHAERLVLLTRAIAQELNLSPPELDLLELLATLHDLGKMGVRDKILTKRGRLTELEWNEMYKHPEIGCRIAKASTELAPIAECILYHHERWDGKGYPAGLSGEDIPLLSRILAVADAFDAMTTDRFYRKALTLGEAKLEIKENAGKQFDPNIAQIFLEKVVEKTRLAV